MFLKFKINYHTSWGQNVYVSGPAKELGSNKAKKALPLRYTDHGNWEGKVKVDPGNLKRLEYKYLIINAVFFFHI